MSVPLITALSILKALWRQQPLSAREIHERVEDELGWSYSSTRKTQPRPSRGGRRRGYGRAVRAQPDAQDFTDRANRLPAQAGQAQPAGVGARPRDDGTPAQVGTLANGWEVYGKTGTAHTRLPDGSEDAIGWFVGWASKGGRTLVFARLLEQPVRADGHAGPLTRDAFLGELARSTL